VHIDSLVERVFSHQWSTGHPVWDENKNCSALYSKSKVGLIILFSSRVAASPIWD